MKVFIIGASGLVGSHCLSYFKVKGIDALGSHKNYPTQETVHFDLLNKNCFDILLKMDFTPKVIIHCGALTNVDYCEINEQESKMETLISTEILVDYCKENEIKLVYISTDYVFDGERGPYLEDAEVNPINIYGKHKLQAERSVSELNNFLIARITNVYGEEDRSKNFIAHLFRCLTSSIDKNFNLAYDQFATPIYAQDIARMLYLLISDNKTGVYHLASTDYYNRYQLAKKVQSYYNCNTSVKLNPILTSQLNQIASRPLNGGLLNHKFSGEYPEFEYTNVDKFILQTYKNGI
jgi:dTDP-4-dehydrorhamnose reductase